MWKVSLSVICFVAIVIIDQILPLGLAAGMLYLIPVMLTLFFLNEKSTLIICFLSLVAVALHFVTDSGGDAVSPLWAILFVRLLTSFMIVSLSIVALIKIKEEKNLMSTKKKLEISNKELEYFASVSSHDLKAPLRAISHLVKWLVLERDVPGKFEEYTTLMVSNIERAERLIDGILEYSRIKKTNGFEYTNLSETVGDIISTLPTNFEYRVGTLPIIYINPTMIYQVFNNLISNSVKHHDKDSGRITVAHNLISGFHEFTVADDGPGILPIYHDKIFDIFRVVKSSVESSGIGLAITKKIINNLGGSIRVVSNGRGTKMIFTLPVNR